ncbi:MAG: DNA polymerase III subunit delta [Rhodobacteraceae bacterium]|nr:MAG: DNA polymerase III subunit delta [Paracoccaceae bacterium]
MKAKAAEIARFCAAPPSSAVGALIYGEDPSVVAARREALAHAVVGAQGEAEMRLERLAAPVLRRDPAALDTALRARGFFAGRRCVVLTEAADPDAPAVAEALADAAGPEAFLVVTAGSLAARSPLRRVFEEAKAAWALACYADPPRGAALREWYAAAGGGAAESEALAALEALGQASPPEAIRRLVETLALYKLGDPAPLSAADVAALAPLESDAVVDALVAAAADGRPAAARLGPAAPEAVVAALRRHFRALHGVLATMEAERCAPEAAVAKQRPPVFWKAQKPLAAQARRWRLPQAEAALRLLHETEADLRGGGWLPKRAIAERALIRIAMMTAR